MQVFFRVTGLTSDFLISIVVEHIQFFHGALQFPFISKLHYHYYTKLQSLQFSLIIALHLQRLVPSPGFKCKLFKSLSITYFHIFLGIPLCLAPLTSIYF